MSAESVFQTLCASFDNTLVGLPIVCALCSNTSDPIECIITYETNATEAGSFQAGNNGSVIQIGEEENSEKNKSMSSTDIASEDSDNVGRSPVLSVCVGIIVVLPLFTL
jgi:hypothetical protein